jgi:hypothetical protein
VATPTQVSEFEKAQAALTAPVITQQVQTDLAAYIRRQYEMMSAHRTSSSGWDHRLLYAMRAFNGEYDAQKLHDIRRFGGSEVYARITAAKCRGATSMLRDVYLGPQRSWSLKPTPDPRLPDSVTSAVNALVGTEVSTLLSAGQAPSEAQVRDRQRSLMEAARKAALKQAEAAAKAAQDKLDDILVEGRFYDALAEVLIDLPIFPFAVMAGPEVRMVPSIAWRNGEMAVTMTPRMFWRRVSPFDFYFTPGVESLEDGATIEKLRFSRADINDIMDLPGYNRDACLRVLDEYGTSGLTDFSSPIDSERAVLENKEDPTFNQSGFIDGVVFCGPVQGRMLLEWGMRPSQITEPMRDYYVQAWMIGKYVIKCQLAPSPRKRVPYYMTSFEKVPGSLIGNGVPDIISDLQDVCNATLRALVNNVAISSGPQVAINMDRVAPGETVDELFPWKRWRMVSDPFGGTRPPMEFFQPQSNAGELLQVFNAFSLLADDLSAIPRYIAGSGNPGNAGRTASGLAMLMGNASKALQMVAANIDRDIIYPTLQMLYDMVMLTDPSGLLRGDESIEVQGVNVAVAKEAERRRQLEFLQITANPIDAPLLGVRGRAAVLRAVAEDLGLPGDKIVPTDDELVEQQKRLDMAAQEAQSVAAQGGKPLPVPDLARAGAQAQGSQPPPLQAAGMNTNLIQPGASR